MEVRPVVAEVVSMGEHAHKAEVFGPYMVYEQLGVGGMATVHRATRRGIAGFERVVGLKRLLPHLAADADFVRSFVREAKLASMLQHENIVQIYELGRVNTTYFMAMEYIQGHDIRQILRTALRQRRRIPIGVVLSIVGELCDALDYAHARADDTSGEPLGIVHRDVSPSNLIVTPAGHLKVIDFGIAKATSHRLRTETGRVKGKLAYMSPEAVSGSHLDARSDVFSAGVVTHELLSIRPLFASKNDYETLRKIHQGEVLPPSAYNSDVPRELDDVVLAALARSPDERCPSAASMRGALHAVARRHGLAMTHAEVAGWLAGLLGDAEPTVDESPVELIEIDDIDDEVTEIVWGGCSARSDGVVLVPGVPDVSDQIPAPRAHRAPTDDLRMSGATSRPPPLPPTNEHRQGSTQAGVVEVQAPQALLPRITFRGAPTPPLVDELFDSALAAAVTPQPTPPDRPLALGTIPPPGIAPREATSHPGRRRLKALAYLATGAAALLGAATVAYAVGARRTTTTTTTTAAGPTPPRLSIDVTPIDAMVTIDGAATPAASDQRLHPGPHHVTVRCPGYVPWSRDVDLRVGEAQALRVVLERVDATVAHVQIHTSPAGLAVAVDGQVLAGASPVAIELAPGPHEVVVTDEGAQLWQYRWTAEAGTHYELHPMLAPRERIEAPHRRHRSQHRRHHDHAHAGGDHDAH